MDPFAARNVEVKRSALAILYLRKINEWLSKPRNHGHRNYECYECARKAISGEVRKISLKTLETLERVLRQQFDHQIIDNVDLTRDNDEDDALPLQEIQNRASPSLLRSAEQPENIAASVLDHNMNASGSKASTPTAVEPEQIGDDASPLASANSAEKLESPAFTPIARERDECGVPEPNSPAVISPDAISHAIIEALGVVPSAEDQPKSPQPSSSSASNTKTLVRRNSVYDPSMPKPNVPSIADYKLKQSKLQPPSVYAKPIDKDKGARKIISVPYKTAPAPRPLDANFDPKADLIRLQGIKEKIYAKEYLQFDAKQDILKEYQSNDAEKMNPKADDDSSDDSEDLPITKKRRCKSSAADTKKTGKKRGRPRKKPTDRNGSQERKKSPTPPPKKSSSRSRCNRLDSNSSDDVTPSHVLEDNVENELKKLFAEPTSDSPQLSDHRGAVLSTKSILKSSSSLSRARMRRSESIADRSQLVAGKGKKGRKVQNNGAVPVVRGRGRGRGRGSRNQRLKNLSNKSAGTVPVAQKPVVRGRGRGRGRTSRIERPPTNIVSQIVSRETYFFPIDELPPQVFSPETYLFPVDELPPQDSSFRLEADSADDNLLIEIPGTAKPKPPPVVNRYPKRRNAIDQREVQLNVQIKVEASSGPIVVKREKPN